MKITLGHLTSQLTQILKRNAPVRGENMPAGWKMPKGYLRPTPTSLHPGNLKLNGVRETRSGDSSSVTVGGAAAVYADRANETSFKPEYIEKSKTEFLGYCRGRGGKIR